MAGPPYVLRAPTQIGVEGIVIGLVEKVGLPCSSMTDRGQDPGDSLAQIGEVCRGLPPLMEFAFELLYALAELPVLRPDPAHAVAQARSARGDIAAVDGDLGAADKARFIGGEKQHLIGAFLWRPLAVQWDRDARGMGRSCVVGASELQVTERRTRVTPSDLNVASAPAGSALITASSWMIDSWVLEANAAET